MKAAHVAGAVAVGLIAWAAWERFKEETPSAPQAGLVDIVKYQIAASLVEAQMDREFGTHDPLAVPDYLANALRIGSSLG